LPNCDGVVAFLVSFPFPKYILLYTYLFDFKRYDEMKNESMCIFNELGTGPKVLLSHYIAVYSKPVKRIE
jgi:hypothetical protein